MAVETDKLLRNPERYCERSRADGATGSALAGHDLGIVLLSVPT